MEVKMAKKKDKKKDKKKKKKKGKKKLDNMKNCLTKLQLLRLGFLLLISKA